MHVTFPAGEWNLEGVLTTSPGGDRAAVICHPHPLYGGNMNNPVVRAIEEGLQKAGRTTLRFNFRGVGESTGSYGGGAGEGEDLRSAVSWLIESTGAKAITLAGYSFGAMVVLSAGAQLTGVDRLIAVAPPLSFFDLASLSLGAVAKLFIAGDRDQYCSAADLTEQLNAVPTPRKNVILAGADHFLFGYEASIRTAVAEFASADEHG